MAIQQECPQCGRCVVVETRVPRAVAWRCRECDATLRTIADAAERVVEDLGETPTHYSDCYACGAYMGSNGAHESTCSWVALKAALAARKGGA
jgi:hypothetical protein